VAVLDANYPPSSSLPEERADKASTRSLVAEGVRDLSNRGYRKLDLVRVARGLAEGSLAATSVRGNHRPAADEARTAYGLLPFLRLARTTTTERRPADKRTNEYLLAMRDNNAANSPQRAGRWTRRPTPPHVTQRLRHLGL